MRSLVKLGFINERPEHNRDARWSETGDRYMIKLFRDYVFHQVRALLCSALYCSVLYTQPASQSIAHAAAPAAVQQQDSSGAWLR